MNDEKHLSLLEKTASVKRRFLTMYKNANAGHVGSSLSVAEVITYIKFDWMQESDELILSKGHAAAALYSVLAEEGVVSQAEIDTFYKNGTLLAAHPPFNKIKKIPFATGSLGHGLSLSAGLALAGKFKKNSKKIFCICSDGELNEGSIWEAAMFIKHHNLSNLVWLIDRNRFQGYGNTEDVMMLEPLLDKLKAFGFNALEVNGHDFIALEEIKNKTQQSAIPTAIICNTIKGNGWKGKEETVDCHYLPMNDEQYKAIMDSLQNITIPSKTR